MLLRLFLLLALTSLALAQPRGPTPIKTQEVIRKSIAATLSLPGTALAWRQVTVGSPEPGRVQERVRGYFSVPVKKGEVLVRLDDRRAQARHQAAQARSSAARQRYEEVLAGERPETVEEVRAELRRAQAASREATQNLSRIRDLQSRNAATKAQFDQAFRASEVTREETQAAKSRLDRILAGTRKEILRAQEAEWKMAVAEESLARISLEEHQILAPFDGIVDQVHVEVGAWLDNGMPILDLVDTSILDVAVLVPEDRIHLVPLGVEATCLFDRQEEPLAVTGKVASLGAKADMQGRTVPVLVRLRNPDGLLRAGMSARVQIPIEKPQERILVSKDAVLHTNGAPPRVMVVEEGKAQSRQVELGREWQEWVEVLSGLKPGEVAVIRGNERLRPGQEVASE